MRFTSVLDNIKQSRIYRLKHEGELKGLRMKVYNTSTDSFDYYDFAVSTVKENDKCSEFIGRHLKDFEALELVRVNEGTLATRDEIDGTITVKESKSVDELVLLVRLVSEVYTVNNPSEGLM